MSRRTQENLIAAVLLGIFVGIIVLSLDFSPRARLVPLPIAVLGVTLLVVQVILQNLRPEEELHVDVLEFLTRKHGAVAPAREDGAAPAPAHPARGNGGPSARREAVAFAMVLVFLGLILLFGPIPAIWLFTGGYFALSRHYRWPKALGYTTGFTAAVYLVFVVGLQIQLYHGVLEPIIERLWY